MTRPTDTPSSARAAAQAAAPVVSLGRRRFLRHALFGSAAVLAAAGGSFAWLRRSPRDQQPLPDTIRHLSSSEYHLLQRATQVLLPVAGTSLAPLSQVPVIANIDHMMGLLPAHIRKQVAMGLTLFDNAAVVAGWHGRRFVDLDDATAVDYFDRWAGGNSIQRALSMLLKRFVYIAYWRDPVTWPAVEFDGPVSEKWGLAYLGNAPLPQEQEGEGA